MCRKLMYLILSVVVLSLVGNVFAQEPAWDFYIPYAFEPPVLDAEVDAVWRGASTQQIAVPINGTADSALDASGHWQDARPDRTSRRSSRGTRVGFLDPCPARGRALHQRRVRCLQ